MKFHGTPDEGPGRKQIKKYHQNLTKREIQKEIQNYNNDEDKDKDDYNNETTK